MSSSAAGGLMTTVHLRGDDPGEGEGEGGTVAGRALDQQVAAVGLRDAPGDVEPESEPTVVRRRYRSLEAIEDDSLPAGLDADAVISNGELRELAGASHIDLDGATRTELQGVRKQVGDHLMETRGVPDARDRLIRVDLHLAAG